MIIPPFHGRFPKSSMTQFFLATLVKYGGLTGDLQYAGQLWGLVRTSCEIAFCMRANPSKEVIKLSSTPDWLKLNVNTIQLIF